MKSDAATLLICAIFLLAGMLSAAAALFNWEWFFSSSNAKLLTGRMSRRAARTIYFIIGLLIVAMGIFVLVESERTTS